MALFNYFFFQYFFWPFIDFIDSTAEDMTGNGIRERGRDTRLRAPRPGLDPGLPQRGQSLCTWDACSSN